MDSTETIPIRAIVFDCSGVLLTNQPNEPVFEIIRTLRPNYRVGLLSNAYRDSIDQFLRETDTTALFDAVLASSETAFIKPQREIFVEMAARLDVEMNEMLFIDDSPHHIDAATRYGIPSILYESPHQLQQALKVTLNS